MPGLFSKLNGLFGGVRRAMTVPSKDLDLVVDRYNQISSYPCDAFHWKAFEQVQQEYLEGRIIRQATPRDWKNITGG